MQTIGNIEYLSREEAAAFLGCSVHTLAAYAKNGTGPVFYKPNRDALYRESDLIAYIESTKKGGAK